MIDYYNYVSNAHPWFLLVDAQTEESKHEIDDCDDGNCGKYIILCLLYDIVWLLLYSLYQ